MKILLVFALFLSFSASAQGVHTDESSPVWNEVVSPDEDAWTDDDTASPEDEEFEQMRKIPSVDCIRRTLHLSHWQLLRCSAILMPIITLKTVAGPACGKTAIEIVNAIQQCS